MKSPKFSVGEYVAVLTPCLDIAIPSTVVISVEWLDDGIRYLSDLTPVRSKSGYYYGVFESRAYFSEQCLRKIDPFTEYQDEEERELVK